MTAPVCPTCKIAARLTTGKEIYKNRPDLDDLPIWRCDGCQAHVGCHKGTTDPLGTPAGPALRRMRIRIHHRVLDPLWLGADKGADARKQSKRERWNRRRKARKQIYAWLADQLGIATDDCHTGLFDMDMCQRAWIALQGITYRDIKNWHRRRDQQEAA